MILCLQKFDHVLTILTYMLLTWINRTYKVLNILIETYLFQQILFLSHNPYLYQLLLAMA